MNTNRIELFDFQIDEILKALETHLYIYRYAYSRKNDKQEERDISLMKDTYETILNQYNKKIIDTANKDESSSPKILKKKVNNF